MRPASHRNIDFLSLEKCYWFSFYNGTRRYCTKGKVIILYQENNANISRLNNCWRVIPCSSLTIPQPILNNNNIFCISVLMAKLHCVKENLVKEVYRVYLQNPLYWHAATVFYFSSIYVPAMLSSPLWFYVSSSSILSNVTTICHV